MIINLERIGVYLIFVIGLSFGALIFLLIKAHNKRNKK